MKRIRLLLTVVLAVAFTTKIYAGLDTATAWFNSENFNTWTAGGDYKTTVGVTGGSNVQAQTATSTTVAAVSGNVLGFNNKALGTTAFGESSNSTLTYLKTFSTGYTSQYFYVKTAFYHQTTGNKYQLKNAAGNVVFEFGGANSSGGPAVFTTNAAQATTGLGKRAQWSEIEVVLDLINKKIVKCNLANSSLTTKTYTFSNSTIINGTDITSINFSSTGAYTGFGLDNTTIGQLTPDSIKDLTSSQNTHQTLDLTAVNTTLSLTAFTNQMGIALPYVGSTAYNINWRISNWGGLSPADTLLISLARGVSNYSNATLSTSSSISADATITISATFGLVTLTKDILVKGVTVEGLKSVLSSDITASQNAIIAASDVNGYITSAKALLNSSIDEGLLVIDNESAVPSECTIAINNLQAAKGVFDASMTPYNAFLASITSAQSTHDAEIRTATFFTTIKGTLTTAIATATGARSTIAIVDDITTAKSAIDAAKAQFIADVPYYGNMETQITDVTNRQAIATPRSGDSRLLMFTNAATSTLSAAKSTAEGVLASATTTTELSNAKSTLLTALNTFNGTSRALPSDTYYQIYTYGVDNGDGGTTKLILYAVDASTLRYTSLSNPALNANNSKWIITQKGAGSYAIKNKETGTFMSGTGLAVDTMLFTLPEGFSQSNLIKAASDTYYHYYIVNPSNKGLELDAWDGTNGVLTASSAPANRFRFCYQFEPVLKWNGTGTWSSTANWTESTVPTATHDVIINSGTVSMDQNATVGRLDIADGTTLNVNATKSLTINGSTSGTGDITSAGSVVFNAATNALRNLTMNSTGSLTVNTGKAVTATAVVLESDENHSATLIDNGTITGTITVKQYLTGSNTAGTPDGRFWYVTSPISNATSAVFAPSTGNKLWSHSEVDGYAAISAEDVALTAGKGYVARMKDNTTVLFTGTPNTGDKTVGISRTGTTNTFRGFNLIGNPYPSYARIKAADNVDIESSVWFRTKVTATNSMIFDTYNILTGDSVSGSGNPISGFIPPMQAFWVKTHTDGASNVAFKQAYRFHSDPITSGVKLRSAAVDTTPCLRIRLTNGRSKDETLIKLYPNASDGFDHFDSHKMTNNVDSFPEIFTMNGNEELAINGMKHDGRSKTLALGFRTGKRGDFKIKVIEMKNLGDSTRVILKDKFKNCEKELTDSAEYAFTSEVATTTDRFSIVFAASMPTALKNAVNTVSAEAFSTNDNQIQVRLIGSTDNIARITIYSTLGQQMGSFTTSSASTVLNKRFVPGVYLVNIADEGVQITKKVVINQ